MKYVTKTYIYFEVKLWVILIHYPNYNIYTPNILNNIKSTDCEI